MKIETADDIEAIVGATDELIERAKMILDGAPFFTYLPEERYVRLRIHNGKATLVWPEAHAGYYDSCSIEEQTKDFPAHLLLMDQNTIKAWSAEQQRIYDAEQKTIRQNIARIAAENQRLKEIELLASLKAKYEPGK